MLMLPAVITAIMVTSLLVQAHEDLANIRGKITADDANRSLHESESDLLLENPLLSTHSTPVAPSLERPYEP